jgi:hypothetical protein
MVILKQIKIFVKVVLMQKFFSIVVLKQKF